MENTFVPVLDLAPRDTTEGRARLAAAIGQACETSGFFVITGHGVPADLVRRMFAVTNEFFCLPRNEKQRCAAHGEAAGFRDSGESAARTLDEQTPPDLCESFGMLLAGTTHWPENPSAFKEIWQSYATALTELSADLLRLCALALDLPERHFDDRFDRHVSALVANYYYPQRKAPLPGQLRRGAHTDFGALTVLCQQDDLGGLQVRHRNDWLDVPAEPGSFVVNIGDLMAHWTGDRWVSTLHRVTNPPQGDTRSRISLPFFYQPNHDAPGGTGTAGEWMAEKTAKLFAAND